MATGAPDFWRFNPRGDLYPVFDLGELVVRLGGVSPFDRRGDVVWVDGFEDGLPAWVDAPVGTGSSVAVSTVRAKRGAKSCLLTAGSDSSHYANVYTRVVYKTLARMGCEFSFCSPQPIEKLELYVTAELPGGRQRYRVQWRDTNHDVRYYDSNATWVTLATGEDLALVEPLFHIVKLVWDPINVRYVRLRIDEVEYDMTGLQPDVGGGTPSPYTEIQIWNYGRSGQNDLMYVDDVILTVNEP